MAIEPPHLSAYSKRIEAAFVFEGMLQEATLSHCIIAHLIKEWIGHNFLLLARTQQGMVYSPYTEIDIDFYPLPTVTLTLRFSADKMALKPLGSLADRL